MKILLYPLYIFVFVAFGYVSFLEYQALRTDWVPPRTVTQVTDSIETETPPEPEEPVIREIPVKQDTVWFSGIILEKVPFTSQAPLGNWGESMNQEGCEEASILMAHAWATDLPISSADDADREIKRISEYEKKTLGTFVHTSLHDTADTLRNYYSFDSYELSENAMKSDIVDALRKGGIVIVPASGRELRNPFFTPPGPLNHMLVIVGYDPSKKEFITNDPGTKNGKSYRYDENVLYNAIWDYPTSSIDSVVPEKKDKKPMLVVWKMKQ